MVDRPLVKSLPEQIDSQLFGHLDGVGSRLGQVCDTGFVHDPEEMMAQLHLDAAFIEESVEALMADLGLSPQKITDLHGLVSVASREFLLACDKPLPIKTTVCTDTAELKHSTELLLQIVLRALHIIAECTGLDHELRIVTRRYDGNAVVSVETDTLGEPSIHPTDLRAQTLTNLVRDIGGDLQVDLGSHSVRLTLSLETSAKSA